MGRKPGGGIQFWATKWQLSDKFKKVINENDQARSFCSSPEKYRYCDGPCDKRETFAAVNTKCMDLCTAEYFQKGGKPDECLSDAERWYKEDTGMFFPSFFTETVTTFTADANSSGFIENEEHKEFFVKGVEDMEIAFNHGYSVKSPAGEKIYGTNKDETTSYGKGVLTILVDKDNNE